ncbi:TetR/AcrR family transcriptional regulator [Microbulbifer pacificus]|uniref:TetR/AcrR family transcriptional regulator n=1 Tax=Microbulbifer pacificus TaxID=407164 RepID=A0AAU0N2I1_9GAMM|nr:TetR/AcrR family transcriptional regulator [Microbulbifer pacificus]WOX05809.1 TetR/AcrR family transcriptional regulator [Microbulbifer pacificus]
MNNSKQQQKGRVVRGMVGVGQLKSADEARLVRELVSSGSISDPSSPRGRLIGAAARLFQDKGFALTTVRDIAAEVGILSGSIFHHVKNKEELLCAIMLEVTRLAKARMTAAIEQQTHPRDRLLACITCELEAIHGLAVPGFPILVTEWRCLSAENQAKVLAEREQYESIWLQELGQRPPDCGVADPQLARRLLLGALSHTHSWFKPRGRGLTMKMLAEQALLTVWPNSHH